MLRSQHVPTARTVLKGSLGPDRQAAEGTGLVLWQDEIKNTLERQYPREKLRTNR